VKSPVMMALVPGVAIVLFLSLTVYFLFPNAYITLYDMDGLFNPDLNVSWVYPLIVLLSLLVYPMAGWIYATLRYLRFMDMRGRVSDERVPIPSPLPGSAMIGVASAFIGTVLSFPVWLYLVMQDIPLFVILYDDGLSSLGFFGILIAGIFRHWGLNLVLGTVFGAVFGALGALLAQKPIPTELEPLLYEPE
jgi:hypothetical protein